MQEIVNAVVSFLVFLPTSSCISFVSFLFELRNFRLGFGFQQCFLKKNYVCRFAWRFFFPSAVTVDRRK